MNDIKPDMHHLNNTMLLRPENNQVTATKYFVDLDEQLRNLDDEIDGNVEQKVTKNFLLLIANTVGRASTSAYFGETLIELNPHVLEDLIAFNRDGFWPLLFGAPRLFFPKPYQARDRILKAMRGLVDVIDSRDNVASPYLVSRLKLIRDSEFSRNGIDSDLFSLLFGQVAHPSSSEGSRPLTNSPYRINSNSIPNTYCAFLRILTIPGLVDQCREELVTAGYTELRPSEFIDVIPAKVPRLRSFLQECFRTHIISSSIREVLEPTQLSVGDKTWRLEKGGVVNLQSALLHSDEDTHPQAKQFKPWRFLEPALGGDGENPTKGLKPFGGGTSYCPGRVFAEKQIIGFLAAMIMRYDINIVSKNIQMPLNSNFEYITKCPPILVELKKRIS